MIRTNITQKTINRKRNQDWPRLQSFSTRKFTLEKFQNIIYTLALLAFLALFVMALVRSIGANDRSFQTWLDNGAPVPQHQQLNSITYEIQP